MLVGLLLTGMALWIFDKINETEGLTEFAIPETPAISFVFGGAILLISFCGCCGAMRESVCMIMTYAFFLFILLVFQIAMVVYAYKIEDNATEEMTELVKISWLVRDENPDNWDRIQTAYECCGYVGITDYLIEDIPNSCCKIKTLNRCIISSSYKVGCLEASTQWERSYWNTISTFSLGLVAVEIFGIFFACIAANTVRNHRRRSTY